MAAGKNQLLRLEGSHGNYKFKEKKLRVTKIILAYLIF